MNIPNISTEFMDVHEFTGGQLIKFEYMAKGTFPSLKIDFIAGTKKPCASYFCVGIHYSLANALM